MVLSCKGKLSFLISLWFCWKIWLVRWFISMWFLLLFCFVWFFIIVIMLVVVLVVIIIMVVVCRIFLCNRIVKKSNKVLGCFFIWGVSDFVFFVDLFRGLYVCLIVMMLVSRWYWYIFILCKIKIWKIFRSLNFWFFLLVLKYCRWLLVVVKCCI